jgi:hypothetical protein
MTATMLIRLPISYFDTAEACNIIDNLTRLGFSDICTDAVWNLMNVAVWCEGDIPPSMSSIEKHFDYNEFWEWISDRYDDPYQLALCRKKSIHDTVLQGLQQLMFGLLMEWRFLLPQMPFKGGLYANHVEIRPDGREASVRFEYVPTKNRFEDLC